jgi:IclR family pca regulon transcriptional regulator
MDDDGSLNHDSVRDKRPHRTGLNVGLQHLKAYLVNESLFCAIIGSPMSSTTLLDSFAAKNPWEAHAGNPDFVLSLARGMQVIEAFQRRPEGLSVSDISSRTGLSRAAVRRLLITLELLGYAVHSGRLYRLSSRVLQLGFSYLSSNSLEALGFPVIQHVTEILRESSSIGVLQGDEIVYVARSATQRVMSIGLSVGSRLRAYCTSIGRIMLAALPAPEFAAFLKRADLKRLTPKTITEKRTLARLIERVRTEGHALVDEELEIGLRSIAVPVTSRSGIVVGAMNSGVHAARVSKQQLIATFLPVLRKQAGLLGSMLA